MKPARLKSQSYALMKVVYVASPLSSLTILITRRTSRETCLKCHGVGFRHQSAAVEMYWMILKLKTLSSLGEGEALNSAFVYLHFEPELTVFVSMHLNRFTFSFFHDTQLQISTFLFFLFLPFLLPSPSPLSNSHQ